ncbi:MAG: hypothetical protein LUG52_09625 [Clostridia bacterium]|nr:hypothetical protein [Clostridia bacterium]
MKKKILKRVLIGVAIFLGIVIVAVGILVAFQWRNIKALYISMTTDSEVINEMIAESDEQYSSEIKNYLSDSIRDFTDEELAQIASGERSKLDVLASIIAETYGESASSEAESETADSGTDSSSSTSSSSSSGDSADAIVAKHVANLYSYQSEFEGRVSALASSVTAYTHSYKATHPDATWRDAKVAAVSKYLGQATSIESECYSKVDSEIAALRSELKAIGADTAIADQVAAAAETQMELKKSSIMSQYTSKMGS